MIELLDSIYNPILGIDPSGRVIICNRSAEEILNRSRDTVLDQTLHSILKNSKLHKILESKKTESIQKLTIGEKTFLSNRTPLTINNQPAGAIAILQDISELESISSDLKHTRMISEELTAIIESSLDGMYVTDGTGRTLRVNMAYERMTGIRREEVIGQTMGDLIKKGLYDESVTLKVMRTGKPESIVQKVVTGKTVVAKGNPIKNDAGQIILIVTSVRDITELSRLQEDLEKIKKCYRNSKIELKQLRAKVRGDGKYIFASKKMVELREYALRLAQVDSTVLITGESGVGKELFAELIHQNSLRRDNPFIKINCATIPENLLESELFGYVPGAFTGAKNSGKAGLFEIADKGTLFLDEIGDLDLSLQAKLLRALQDQQIYRLGDTKPIRVDVRILTATNHNMKKMVAEKKFREDLFFRLNVVPLVVPPLRERKEAIIKFIYFFLEKYNTKYRFNRQISTQASDHLIAYNWPGNVRELENIIERIVVTAKDNLIVLENLPAYIQKNQDPVFFDTGAQSLKKILEGVERRVIGDAIKKGGSTRKAAKILGINQSTVVRKAKQYHLGQ